MRKHVIISTALVLGLSSAAIAQSQQDHQQHHPGGGAPAQAQPAPSPTPPAAPPSPPGQSQMPMGQMMQGMPEQCRGMMQNMHSCMGTMHQMMQGRMGQGGTVPGTVPGHAGHGTQTAPAHPTAASASTKAYLEAADKMHAPMMQGMQAADPDVAFVRGMIPHHQGAIDMAKVLLQYGKDPQTKKWASDVIREQQREIGEMEAWLKKNAR